MSYDFPSPALCPFSSLYLPRYSPLLHSSQRTARCRPAAAPPDQGNTGASRAELLASRAGAVDQRFRHVGFLARMMCSASSITCAESRAL
jgi:hypothetical protein